MLSTKDLRQTAVSIRVNSMAYRVPSYQALRAWTLNMGQQIVHRGVHDLDQRRRPEPEQQTATARLPSTTNSRPLMSFSSATLSLATSPKITRFTIHRV